MLAHSDTTEVGKDVVGDDQAHGQEEPDQALENVVHDKVRLYHDEIKGHVGPGELCELEPVVPFLERSDEEDEACFHQLEWIHLLVAVLTHDIEHEADEPMVSRKRQEHPIDQDDMLEIVYHAFAVEEVHCRSEEVPVS